MKKLFPYIMIALIVFLLGACDALGSNDEKDLTKRNDDVIDSSLSISDQSTEDYFAKFEERYLQYIYDHFTEIGLIEYLEGERFFVKDVDVFEYPSSISEQREYTYFLDASINSAFDKLTEREQFDLLSKINVAERFEYYEGNQFSVETIELFHGTDVFEISAGILHKNNENFWSQLEDPFNN